MISSQFQAILARSGMTYCHLPVDVRMEYNETDPLAFSVMFSVHGVEASPWVVSRDLLAEAMTCDTPTGHGAVRFCRVPLAGHLMMCVKSPYGHADVKLPLQQVEEFLEQSQPDADIATSPVIMEAAVDEAIRGILGGR